jgi:ribosomal-protein-alanine N-acetyltransferase
MELATPRLVLREIRESDFADLHEIYSDPETQRFERIPLSEEESRSKLKDFITPQTEKPRTRFFFAVTVRPEDKLIGFIKLALNIEEAREYEIGWMVKRAYWGKGYAPEAALEVLSFAFTQLNTHRVVAFCNAKNVPSYRVMEKLGMQREGYLRETRQLNNTWHDELVYAILEREFSPRPELTKKVPGAL